MTTLDFQWRVISCILLLYFIIHTKTVYPREGISPTVDRTVLVWMTIEFFQKISKNIHVSNAIVGGICWGISMLAVEISYCYTHIVMRSRHPQSHGSYFTLKTSWLRNIQYRRVMRLYCDTQPFNFLVIWNLMCSLDIKTHLFIRKLISHVKKTEFIIKR